MSNLYLVRYLDDGRQKLQDFLADNGYQPEDCLGVTDKDFAYPIIDQLIPYTRCDNDLWRDLAHDIVPDAGEITKTESAIRLAHWLATNIAFDRYVKNALGGLSRATVANDWSGKYSVYELHCGKCVDFATIYCIMCREMGIPCDSIATDTHVWNVLYLDGRWTEFDIVSGVQYRVNGADPVADSTTEPTTLSPWYVATLSTDYSDLTLHEGMVTYNFVMTGEC